jgi:hypothetical protein
LVVKAFLIISVFSIFVTISSVLLVNGVIDQLDGGEDDTYLKMLLFVILIYIVLMGMLLSIWNEPINELYQSFFLDEPNLAMSERVQ